MVKNLFQKRKMNKKLNVLNKGKFEKVSDVEALADHKRLVLDNRIIEVFHDGFLLRKIYYALSFLDAQIEFRCEQLGVKFIDGVLTSSSVPCVQEQINGVVMPSKMLKAQLNLDLVKLAEQHKEYEKLRAKFKESHGFNDVELESVIVGSFDWSAWEKRQNESLVGSDK